MLAAATRSCKTFVDKGCGGLCFLQDRLVVHGFFNGRKLHVSLASPRLSPAAQAVAEAMRTRVLEVECDATTNVPQMLNFLSHISSRGDLVVKATNKSVCRAILELMRSEA